MEQAVDFIKQCWVEDNVVKFPDVQLERDVYLGVAKRLQGIGGKWNRKHNGFVFKHDPTMHFEVIKSGETINLQREFQAFFTPKEVVNEMIYWGDISEVDYILEPSAGQGAIVDGIKDYCTKNEIAMPLIHCCEIQEANRRILEAKGYEVVEEDFMQFQPKGTYNLIMANPPFTKNQDIDHIYKMFDCLCPGGRIVTLASQSWMHGSQKKHLQFQDWLNNEDNGSFLNTQYILPEDSFKESGTKIRPVMLVIDKE